MKKLILDAKLEARVLVDSAGTGSYHVGEPPDRRSAAAARERGVELVGEARQFLPEDYARFDYIVAMDRRNLGFLKRAAPGAADLAKLHLLRAFDPTATDDDVPDPYFENNFDTVFDICHAGCAGLLSHIIAQHSLPRSP